MARIIDAFTQFFDDNGDPLVDGFLKFVESGTNNTDKDTFADINETIANANPVPLDGAGRCPNVFGTGSYNVISYTDAMVQIQQFDPVGADAATGAFVSWDSATIYDDGALVTGSDGLYYRSISANNQNQDPLTSPGQWEEVKFIGIWNTNITYAAGDSVYGSDGFLYMSRTDSNSGNDPISDTTNWRPGAEIQYTKGADLTTSDVTAGALALGTDGNYFDFTGTDTITSIDTVGVGAIVKIHFDAAATLTHDAADLFLPGGANITTAAGDEAEFFEYAAGDWRCTNYTKASGESVIPSGGLASVQVFTSSGTWTKPAGITKVTVEIVGGGGGGAGAASGEIGSGGGGGGYALEVIDVSAISSETVTIGAAGAAGSASGNGGNGGATSFGAHCSATGGSGGAYSAGGDAGGAAGVGSGGDINIDGQAGGPSSSGSATPYDCSGGGSMLGLGGPSPINTGTVGYAGSGYGAGGGGAADANAGAAGTTGVIIVKEYK